MSRSFLSIAIFLVSAGVVAGAEAIHAVEFPPRPASPDEWRTFHANLCQYDSRYCARLTNSGNGSRLDEHGFVRPLPELLDAMRFMRAEIIQIAAEYDVDPRAIAGAILAENTMNVGLGDKVQEFLVMAGTSPKGSVLGHQFTFGFGQLNCSVAVRVEPIVAAKEGRAIRTSGRSASRS